MDLKKSRELTPQFKKGLLPSMQSLGFAVEDYRDFQPDNFEQHRIDVVLLSFIYGGKAVHHLEDESFTEGEGDLSITHYGQKHAIESEACDVFNIYVDPEKHPLPILPEELQATLSQLIPLHPNFYHNQNRIMRIKVSDISGMLEILRQIERELLHPQLGHEEMMRLYFKTFLMRVCREAKPQLKELYKLSVTNPMERLRQHLDRNFRQPIGLPALAEEMGIHPNSLSRAFKKHTGFSPMEYLVRRRLHLAMLDLRSTDNKVFYVAMDAGFSDVSLFNRLFKRHLGVTPGQYRKQFS